MATQDLKEFVEARLRAFDPNIDLTAGSPAQYQVVDPIVRRFMPDPFEMSVESFILARLTQEYPDVNFRQGSGVEDLLVKPASLLLEPGSREIQILKQGQSLANPELLSDTQADSLVANMFVSRTMGGLSTGTVRLYFNAPVALTLSTGNICYTSSGLRYIPTTLQSISAEAMLFNQSGGLYYFDIQVTAEKAGADYNINKQEIVGITNLNSAVLVENVDSFENGLDEESTEELVQKAQVSITERSLVVARGVSARLRSQFEDLVHLQIVGMLDAEMQRDIITGGDLGEILLSGVDGYSEDDGDGDELTYSIKSRYGDFTTIFGSVGTPTEKYYIVLSTILYGNDAEVPDAVSHIISNTANFDNFDPGGMWITTKASNSANIGASLILNRYTPSDIQIDRSGVIETGMSWVLLRKPQIVEIESIVNSKELLLKTAIPINRPALIWSIHQKKITVSDIPGGIVFSSAADGITVHPDEIHIGGAADFYIRGTGTEKKELVIPSISDSQLVIKGLNLVASTLYSSFVYAPDTDFVLSRVKVGHSLIIGSGVNAGVRNIVRVGVKPVVIPESPGVPQNYLQVDIPISSSASGIRYEIVDEIDIDLCKPRVIRGEGLDLQTDQLSSIVSTSSAVDFLALGAEEQDILEINAGNDIGTYSVGSISGTGNKFLNLTAQMRSTANNLSWSLYKAYDGISLPLVRIRSVDILDSSKQPTGYDIPYARPIDVRTSSFSNMGNGVKLSTNDAITGIVSSFSIDSLLPITDSVFLEIKINNGVSTFINLTDTYSKAALLNAINTAIPDIAGVLSIDGEDYLTLRSGDRWIQVIGSSNNAYVGLSEDGEDNRQIRSAGNILDWTAVPYDLKIQRDVVSIRTGDNIGYLYFVQVESNRILVVGFDEVHGRVRFLQPNIGVSLVIGSRSYGKARVYFLDPTSFQVRGSWHPALKSTDTYPSNKAIYPTGFIEDTGDEEPVSYFTATIAGSSLRFFPDPDLKYEILPASGDIIPNNLTTNGAALVESDQTPVDDLGKNSRHTVVNFLSREIHIGDVVDITYQPIQGTRDITSTTSGGLINYDAHELEGLTLILTMEENPIKTVIFSDQLTGPSDVIAEINEAMGATIAYIETIGVLRYLRLEADFAITLHSNSTSFSKFFNEPPSSIDNYANANIDGYYTVIYVGDSAAPEQGVYLELEDRNALPFLTHPLAGQAQHFIVYRPGIQRIHSTLMNSNLDNGLYYMDVELVSEGVGDQWNLDQEEKLEVTGYLSDGYWLVVGDSNLSYSMEEQIRMVLSRKILTIGSSDRCDLATQLSDQNIQINYDRSSLVSSVQSFASSDLERVLCASLLVRHLQPHYLNFTLLYRGGSSADIVNQDVESYLDNLGPDDRVEVDSLQNIAHKRGASSIKNPMELVAIVHDEERNITIDRSEDYVTHGRLSTFFPGTIVVTRETNTGF